MKLCFKEEGSSVVARGLSKKPTNADTQQLYCMYEMIIYLHSHELKDAVQIYLKAQLQACMKETHSLDESTGSHRISRLILPS